MSILTKEERANHRSRSEAATCSQWMIRSIARDVDFCPYTELIRALDTIDALEAERDRLRDLVESWSRTAKSLDGHRQINLDAIDELETKVREIKSIAKTNQNTHTITWSPAALRQILAVIEGSGEEEDLTQACLKCTGTGFIQAPCTGPRHKPGREYIECRLCPGGWGLVAEPCDACCADVEGDQ